MDHNKIAEMPGVSGRHYIRPDIKTLAMSMARAMHDKPRKPRRKRRFSQAWDTTLGICCTGRTAPDSGHA